MRLFGGRHPDAVAFTRFLDGEASVEEVREVQEHLSRCDRCRADLSFYREVSRAARELEHPKPPAGLVDEVAARREAGERVILPSSPPEPEDHGAEPAKILLVLILLLLGSAAAFFLSSDEATAGANTLRISPEAPGAGRSLTLEFRAASPLAAEERLRVRGWYRTAEEFPPRETPGTYLEGELERDGRGRFTGELRLPPAAVYAAFVVEDPEGERAATNGGRLWEVLAHDEAGVPLLAALRQKLRVEEFRQSPSVLETARRMTDLYPNSPEGWSFLFFYERQFLPERLDSIRARHRDILRDLDRRLWPRERLPGPQVVAMANYVRWLEEEEVAGRWYRRLQEEHPLQRHAVQRRVLALSARHADDPGALLRALDQEWKRVGPVSEYLARRGFLAAHETGDAEVLATWAPRYRRLRPDVTDEIADRMADLPPLRERAAGFLRDRLASLASSGPDAREPTLTVDAQASANRRNARRLLASLGGILLAEGWREAALDTLALAAEEGWDPALFRKLAPLHLEAGDTATALELASRVAVDPVDPAAPEAVLGRQMAARLDGTRWKVRLRRARREMERRVLAEADARRFPLSETVRTEDGTVRPLEELIPRRPTLFVYCAPAVYFCRSGFDRVERSLSRIRSEGASVLLVLGEEAETTSRYPLPESLPTAVDAGGSLPRALGDWATPQYTVLDNERRMRFHHGNPDDAVRQLLVLATRGR